jgi:hypothetical protein
LGEGTVAKKKPAQATRPEERHAAYLAYQLGYGGTMFPLMAASFWRTADIGDPLPGMVPHLIGCLRDSVQRLSGLAGGEGGEEGRQLTALVDRLNRNFEEAWCGPAHRAVIAQRDRSAPEFQAPEDMMAGSIFSDQGWQELEQRIVVFAGCLSQGARPWVLLGSAVARALDPTPGTSAAQAIPALTNQLAEMRPHPLLEGLTLRITDWPHTQVFELHDRVLTTLAGEAPAGQAPGQDERPGGPTGPTPEGAISLPPGLTKEALSIAVLASDPTLSDAEVARLVGCARTSLYRMAKYVGCRETLEQGRHERRKGHIVRHESGQADVEAIDA